MDLEGISPISPSEFEQKIKIKENELSVDYMTYFSPFIQVATKFAIVPKHRKKK